jgi:hypothetical protein
VGTRGWTGQKPGLALRRGTGLQLLAFGAADAGQESAPTTIQRRVHELRPWFHNLDLRGVRIAPDHVWAIIRPSSG